MYYKSKLDRTNKFLTNVYALALFAWDTFFLDWVLFANIKKIRLPGTEHMDKEYHQKWFHIKVCIPMISLLAEKYPNRHYTGLDLTPAMLPIANMLGHGDVKIARRKTVMECCKKAGLKVEKFEIRKGMRMHCVVRKI